MREDILKILGVADRELRAKEIAPMLGKWTLEIAYELNELWKEGFVTCTYHPISGSDEYYYTWRLV